ncbi:MAG: hypothetical protein H6529_10470 [Nocardioides sp.]|nr:hypothetical protein [Nocardioides sp.]
MGDRTYDGCVALGELLLGRARVGGVRVRCARQRQQRGHEAGDHDGAHGALHPARLGQGDVHRAGPDYPRCGTFGPVSPR